MTSFTPIETRYAGCRFRSRLEARWAVFFDAMNIPWEYEPQGYTLSNGRNYLPDFLLPECGTWIEVKGSAAQFDTTMIEYIAQDMPTMPGQAGHKDFDHRAPKWMILGPIPAPQNSGLDYGWQSAYMPPSGYFDWRCFGFGAYPRAVTADWHSMTCGPGGYRPEHADLVTPCLSRQVGSTHIAYAAARSARFEHGEQG